MAKELSPNRNVQQLLATSTHHRLILSQPDHPTSSENTDKTDNSRTELKYNLSDNTYTDGEPGGQGAARRLQYNITGKSK